jgi:hypothetical protein
MFPAIDPACFATAFKQFLIFPEPVQSLAICFILAIVGKAELIYLVSIDTSQVCSGQCRIVEKRCETIQYFNKSIIKGL